MSLLSFIRGFLMAMADSVPGVSGGTIAFILGFYDRFISSLNALSSKGDPAVRKEALSFILKLGVGWVPGMIISVIFLASLFEKNIYAVSSLFIGFILMAIPLILREEKEVLKGRYPYLIFTLLGAALVFFLSYFNPSSGEGMKLAWSSLNPGLVLYVFISAMAGISAMVLPGISGSTILLIFGVYTGIIGAIKNIMTLQFEYLPILIIFTLGMLVGIKTTIKGIRYALKNHRAQAIYMVLGLMLGSFYAIFMGPSTLEVPKPPMAIETFNVWTFLLGAGLILGLDRLRAAMEKKQR